MAIFVAASRNNLVKGIDAYAVSDRKTGVMSLTPVVVLAVAGLAPLAWVWHRSRTFTAHRIAGAVRDVRTRVSAFRKQLTKKGLVPDACHELTHHQVSCLPVTWRHAPSRSPCVANVFLPALSACVANRPRRGATGRGRHGAGRSDRWAGVG
jgi:hypothetical protein